MTEQEAQKLSDMIKILTYAKKIKEYCQNNVSCDECCFYRNNECAIGYFAVEEREWDDDGYMESEDIYHVCVPKDWGIGENKEEESEEE